jgi:hypothetical protein
LTILLFLNTSLTKRYIELRNTSKKVLLLSSLP